MRIRDFYQVTKKAVLKMDKHDGPGLASEAAFHFAFSFFPFLMLLVSIVGLFSQDIEARSLLMQTLGQFMPEETVGFVDSYLATLARADIQLGLSVSAILVLWASSRVIAAYLKAITKAYEAPDRRPFWKKRLLAISLVLLFGVFGGIAFMGMVFTPVVAKFLGGLGWDEVFLNTIEVLRFPFTVLMFSPAMAILYRFGPDCQKHPGYQIWPGAMMATLLWVTMSYGFSLYVSQFGEFDATYGALGTIIILLTWMWLTSLVVIFGAEFNASFADWVRTYVPRVREGLQDAEAPAVAGADAGPQPTEEQPRQEE